MASSEKVRCFLTLALIIALTVGYVPPTVTAQGFAALVTRVKPAVVFVATVRPNGALVTGSGFLIRPDGYILTTRHVIFGGGRVFVRLPIGIVEEAQLVGSSSDTDTALLKIPGTNLPTIPLGDSSTLRQGDEVLVFGYPGGEQLGLEDVTVTRGIVSALRLNGLVIQIDAAINRGSSGGPVVNADGLVMGIAFAFSPQFAGVNFAVSVLGAAPLLSGVPGGVAFASKSAGTEPVATPQVSPVIAYADINGNWEGVWASARVSRGGVFVASFSQDAGSFTGTVALNGSPCFGAFQVSGGFVLQDSFSLGALSGGRTRALLLGTVSGKTLTGFYTVLATGTICDGDEGNVNAARR